MKSVDTNTISDITEIVSNNRFCIGNNLKALNILVDMVILKENDENLEANFELFLRICNSPSCNEQLKDKIARHYLYSRLEHSEQYFLDFQVARGAICKLSNEQLDIAKKIVGGKRERIGDFIENNQEIGRNPYFLTAVASKAVRRAEGIFVNKNKTLELLAKIYRYLPEDEHVILDRLIITRADIDSWVNSKRLEKSFNKMLSTGNCHC